MKKIGIIYGGKSVEHEVSIITGLQVYENLDKSNIIRNLFILIKTEIGFLARKNLKI